MKRIVLDRLIFRNFKGFREFVLEANGENLDVYGDNGTGKTTLFDGFTWTWFGKDSENRSEFEIKELDSAGKVRQHRLEHEVEAVLIVDGRRRTFRRVYSEKWTKKRGALKETYTGHETTYYVDGVPVLKGEYDAEVDALIPEGLFKLLTNPGYFNDDKHFKWLDRRKMLLEVCGDVTDAEVIHSNPALNPLEAVLQERDLEKHKAIMAERMKKIKEETKDIPIRISEADRGKPDVSELSEELLQEDIESLRAQIAAKNAELARIQDGGEIAVKERRLREIEGEQLAIKSRLQTAALDAVARQRETVSKLHQAIDPLRRTIDDREQRIRRNQQTIEVLEKQREQLRNEFAAAKESAYVHNEDENCPTCGQLLPEDRRKEAHAKALAAFNRSKAEQLEAIQRRGQTPKAEAERLSGENDRYRKELDQAKAKLQPLEEQVATADAELTRLREAVKDPTNDPGYIQLQQEAIRLQTDISLLRNNAQPIAERIEQEIAKLQQEVADFEADIAKFDQVRKQETRITELEQQEKELSVEYEQLERELFLVEEFTRTKVNLLQSRIDSKFRFARFRLFEDQINGGFKECCETLYNGVPYHGGLNKAAQINVDLDIINTFIRHYGISAPIFIDNAEAVTELAETDTQVIRLIVPPSFEKLPDDVRQHLISLAGSAEKARADWIKRNSRLRIEAINSKKEAI